MIDRQKTGTLLWQRTFFLKSSVPKNDPLGWTELLAKQNTVMLG